MISYVFCAVSLSCTLFTTHDHLLLNLLSIHCQSNLTLLVTNTVHVSLYHIYVPNQQIYIIKHRTETDASHLVSVLLGPLELSQ